MVKINVLDHVKHCYSHSDGEIILDLIKRALARGENVVVSFKGVLSVPSSFVNGAFIPLLDDYSFEEIKRRMHFVDSTVQINEMIRKRFYFEVNTRKNLMNV